ncbi:hypothetical protein Ngar_c08500 [Candidatus Nitrososphaera gargensis Ga9.2]|uniref:Uncharacterized protein n=1 Tax=Nitrososphaera gargensis (strain Ga9.2) TaxID=1237085 RepID=K0IID6_NITGG|nr:hypothetical protein [Candidatus Nitrososphaera gargensis]AFU57792.1 hypothetical protein Ngar_c08500 [Candidatus Nitrososphaera gargensis Ga9.2]
MAGGISISDTAKLEAMIHSLGLLITIGKYLPLMIAGFATLNLILAYFDLFVWGHIAPGIFNVILAVVSLIFLGQLLKRRKIHRYEYRYRGRHLNMQPSKKALDRKRAEVAAAD